MKAILLFISSLLGMVSYWYFVVYSLFLYAIKYGNFEMDIIIAFMEIILIYIGFIISVFAIGIQITILSEVI